MFQNVLQSMISIRTDFFLVQLETILQKKKKIDGLNKTPPPHIHIQLCQQVPSSVTVFTKTAWQSKVGKNDDGVPGVAVEAEAAVANNKSFPAH